MRTALIDSTPDFLRFLEAARATPGDRWGQYEEAYLSTHGAVLQGMLATHLFWLGLSMRELVERMDLGWYADRVQAWQKRDGSREIALALQAAEKALPPIASFPPEVNLIWGFGMVDGGLTFARGHPVLILGLELVAVNRNLAHLVQHEYAHLVRIAHPDMFVGQSAFLPDGTPSRYGYYVGASMVARLISERGWHAYPDLLVSDAKRVLALFEQATREKP